MWHFNRIAQGCLKCMPMIPVISWQPGHGSLSAHFSPVSSTEDKHLVANFEQVAQTRNDVTATYHPSFSLSCCDGTGAQRMWKGASAHLPEVHVDLVKGSEVSRIEVVEMTTKDGMGRNGGRSEEMETDSMPKYLWMCHMHCYKTNFFVLQLIKPNFPIWNCQKYKFLAKRRIDTSDDEDFWSPF